MIRIAIIGCGAVSERFHLPALLAHRDCAVTALVDRNSARTAALQAKVAGAVTAIDATEVLSQFDAAILAVPHYLHAPLGVALLRLGKHLLVEKPMALSSDECAAMLEAARVGGASLTIGHMRRFCPAVALAKGLLDSGVLGRIERLDVRDGVVFGWPVESDFQFRKDRAGGGVLVDTGAHTLDMLVGWLGEVRPLGYRDDAHGGVEADCEIELETHGGAPVRVELSRTRNLRNSALIVGERGQLDVRFYTNQVVLELDGVPSRVPFECGPRREALVDPSPWRHMFIYQLDDWLSSIREGRAAKVSGSEGAKVVRLIQRLYAIRKPLIHSWE